MKEEKVFSYLLHVKLWHVPFHLLGGGPKPSSEKDGEPGHIPVSSIPMITSPSSGSSSMGVWGKSRKSQDLVVKRSRVLLGKTETTSFMPKGNKEKGIREMLALQFVDILIKSFFCEEYQLKVDIYVWVHPAIPDVSTSLWHRSQINLNPQSQKKMTEKKSMLIVTNQTVYVPLLC